jgi:glycerate 2-kinase
VRPRALACPCSLKGVLSAREAAAALAAGLARGGVDAVELPVADGGEGSLEALAAARRGEWREAEVADAFGRPRPARWLLLRGGVAAIEAAEAIPLDPGRLDPMAASSRGLGQLVRAAAGANELLVCLGGTATVDGGRGLREVVASLPSPTRVACDVSVPLLDAARVFAAQKGATAAQALALEARLAAMPELRRYAHLPGAGAAGGLGAAFAALGAELQRGAPLILDELGFEPRGFDLVVTGEGTVDRTTGRGKAPGEVAARCREAGVRCVVFGGRVVEALSGVETVALSGDPERAREDLQELGERLAGALLGLA